MSDADAPVVRTAGGAVRWTALDALRGLAIAAMIVVNNPGDWGHVYAPLQHAKWHGCTFTDLVFPTFLFCAGAAVAPALDSALARGAVRSQLLARSLKRAALLFGIGLFLNSFPVLSFGEGQGLFDRVWSVRVMGVLQRIGLCFAAVAALHLYASPRAVGRVLAAALLAYWPLLALCPVPGGGAPDLGSQGEHLAGWLDRAVLGSHTWMGRPYDPEGLLSTIPAACTAGLGLLCGRVLRQAQSPREAVPALLLRGCSWMALGAVWGWFFPLNKALWTSSFALFTGGIAAVGLGLFVQWFDVEGRRLLRDPLCAYGRNALLVFCGSAVLARTLSRLWIVEDGPPAVSMQRLVFQRAFADWAPDPYVASLLFALAWALSWGLVLRPLYRRGIVWRV